jgi:hypothetical protein
MASQVLSGSSNVSYTNNTGQNVRIVINYMKSGTSNISMNWAGVSVNANLSIIGRNLAFSDINFSNTLSATVIANNAFSDITGAGDDGGLPTELMLASGQTFSVTGINAYNIVVIPEGG